MKIRSAENLIPKSLAVALIGATLSFLTTHLAFADLIGNAEDGVKSADGGASASDVPSLLQNLTNALLFLVGAISVIMIIIGGIRFILSQGDPQASANARNTVLYSIIGVVVAVAAWGILNWVLGKLY